MTLSKSGRTAFLFSSTDIAGNLLRRWHAYKNLCKQQQPISQGHLKRSLISTTFRTTARSYNEVGKYLYQNVFDSRAPGTVVALIAATTPLLEVGRHANFWFTETLLFLMAYSVRLAFPLLQFLLGRKEKIIGNCTQVCDFLRNMTNATYDCFTSTLCRLSVFMAMLPLVLTSKLRDWRKDRRPCDDQIAKK